MRPLSPYSMLVLAVLALASVDGCPPAADMGADDPDNANSNANANDNNGGSNSSLVPESKPVVPDAAPAAPVEPAPPPLTGATALLNEIRFSPREGEHAFAELKAAAGSALAGLKLVSDGGTEFVIPAGAAADDSGIAVVLFDDASGMAGNQISAAPGDFLNPTAGSLTLMSAAGAELDRIAWGPDQPETARLSRGGGSGPEDAAPGMSIGRFPQSVGVGWEGWTAFAPGQTTPGAPNPNPGAAVLLPLSGFTVLSGQVQLSWYPVENATAYMIQVSTSADFASLTLDAMVDTAVTQTTLAQGTYYWRVQSIDADGMAADWSPVNVLYVTDTVDTSATGDSNDTSKPRGRLQGRGTVTRVNLDGRSPGGAFPSFSQKKDSPLLLLESDRTAMGHAWDGPHMTCDTNDPADNMNCTLASTQMINHFYGGDLTQDRIGYDAHHADAAGPETDLNFNEGNWPDKPLRFALGAPVGYTTPAAYSYATLWMALTDAIDDGRPMLLVIISGAGTHSIAAHGYEIDTTVVPTKFSIIVNDPWNHGSASALRGPMEYYALANRLARIYIVPKGVAGKKQEKEVTTDTDRDGVFDFDEKSRFGTRWDGRTVNQIPSSDSDKDCLTDKMEIERSVLDPKHGYAIKLNQKKGDGKARGNPPGNASPGGRKPELLLDTDGGGLPDAAEDWNLDGKPQDAKGESDPYDKSDDPRTITGTLRIGRNQIEDITGIIEDMYVEHMCRLGADGKITGTVKVTHNSYQYYDAAATDECAARRIETNWDEWTYMTSVKGRFDCVHPVIEAVMIHSLDPVGITIVDPCDGTDRVTGANYFGTWGITQFPNLEISGSPGRVVYKGHHGDPAEHSPSQFSMVELTFTR
ncbi:hypothetical protein RAS1_21440 [Phycisphaerae bacterium RAS1]|nr:hypothetical protein RAS1_21440 [Phycisphaerae bacterium RAS1]